MKRLMNTVLALSLCAGLAMPAGAAQVGEVVDYALHTDIVAQINGNPLRSYNVGGRTAVVVRDLEDYGFVINWDATNREVRLLRKVDSQNNPITPVSWPQYTPDKLKAPVGSPAETIYATDIKTYVSGAQVEGFNIGGKTLIWFNDLACYGDVVWDEASRTANLVLGDPMEHALEQEIRGVKQISGANAEYQVYTSSLGKLFVGRYTPAGQGEYYRMIYVNRQGERISINDMLPEKDTAQGYFKPRSVLLRDNTLVFNTTLDDERQHQMVVDLSQRKLLSTTPMSDAMTKWSITTHPAQGETLDEMECLEIVLGKEPGKEEVKLISQTIPFGEISVKVSNSGVVVYIERNSMTNMGDGSFATACRRLYRSGIPSIFHGYETFNRHNSQGQRETAGKYFKVTYNSTRVTGDLFWAGKSSKRELRFDFDHKLSLKEGDKLTIWMGLDD